METRHSSSLIQIRQDIKALISSNEEVPVFKYSFHIPMEDKKESTQKNFDALMEYVQQLPFIETLELMKMLLDEAENNKSILTTKIITEKNLQSFLGAVKNLRSAFDMLSSKKLPVDNLLDEAYVLLIDHDKKKFKEDWKVYLEVLKALYPCIKSQEPYYHYKELFLVTESFYSQFCILIRKLQLKKILLKGNAGLEVNPAKVENQNFEEKISSLELEALKVFGALDIDEIFPIILLNLQIMIDVLNKEPKEKNITESISILSDAKKKLSEANQKQRITISLTAPFASASEIKKALKGISKETIIKDFDDMTEGSKKIYITSAMRPVMEETRFLFAALHYAIFAKAPRNKDGSVNYNAGSDVKDKAFYKATGLYKAHIGDYYLNISRALKASLNRDNIEQLDKNDMPIRTGDQLASGSEPTAPIAVKPLANQGVSALTHSLVDVEEQSVPPGSPVSCAIDPLLAKVAPINERGSIAINSDQNLGNADQNSNENTLSTNINKSMTVEDDNIFFKKAAKESVRTIMVDGMTYVIVAIKTENKPLISTITNMSIAEIEAQNSMFVKVHTNDNEFALEFAKYSNRSEDDRINELFAWLSRFWLTPNQKIIVHSFLPRELTKILDSYVSNYWLGFFKNRAHASDAEDLKKMLSEKAPNYDDIFEKFRKFYDGWDITGSTLKEPVKGLLIKIINKWSEPAALNQLNLQASRIRM